MAIKWLSKAELKDGYLKTFLEMFEGDSSNKYISNIDTRMKVVQVSNDLQFNLTINDTITTNSYVCSPFHMYVTYAEEELKKKVQNKWLQQAIKVIIKLLSLILRTGKIDRNIQVNNFLLSTNPYPKWDGNGLAELTKEILAQYPTHAILFKSLNEYQHKNLLHVFSENHYLKICSRQVYIYNSEYAEWINHKSVKRDLQLIKKQKLNYIPHEEMGNYLEDAFKLYNLLYIKKYSQHNPQFTLAYIKKCYTENAMHFQGYKNEQGELKAFAGSFIVNDTITTPLLGYDTTAPQKDGLYIHANNLTLQYKFKHNLIANLSSGASQFKLWRGGEASLEFTVIYIRHLPFTRKMAWYILQFISNHIGMPILKKYKL
jgi:hypothetical protein